MLKSTELNTNKRTGKIRDEKITNGNRTKWSPIQSVIIRVRDKIRLANYFKFSFFKKTKFMNCFRDFPRLKCL